MIAPAAPRRLAFFERYLSLWVALCIAAGVAVGAVAPDLVSILRQIQVKHANR